jgi:hypothetical protein
MLNLHIDHATFELTKETQQQLLIEYDSSGLVEKLGEPSLAAVVGAIQR